MDIEGLKKDVIQEMNRDNEVKLKHDARDIIREIIKRKGYIAEREKQIKDLQKQLQELTLKVIPENIVN